MTNEGTTAGGLVICDFSFANDELFLAGAYGSTSRYVAYQELPVQSFPEALIGRWEQQSNMDNRCFTGFDENDAPYELIFYPNGTFEAKAVYGFYGQYQSIGSQLQIGRPATIPTPTPVPDHPPGQGAAIEIFKFMQSLNTGEVLDWKAFEDSAVCQIQRMTQARLVVSDNNGNQTVYRRIQTGDEVTAIMYATVTAIAQTTAIARSQATATAAALATLEAQASATSIAQSTLVAQLPIVLDRILEGHTDEVIDLKWSPTGGILASVSSKEDGNLHLWQADEGKLLRTLPGFERLSWCLDGELLATKVREGIAVRQVNNGEVLVNFRLGADSLALSPDCSTLALGQGYYSDPNTLYLLSTDANDDQSRQVLHSGHSTMDVAWSPNGQILASTSMIPYYPHDYGLRLWRSSNGELLHYWEGRVDRIAWAPNGQILAVTSHVSSDNRSIYVLRTGDGRLLSTLSNAWGSNLTWSPDSRIIASASSQEVGFWEANTGDLLYILAISEGRISSLAWSPDGETLAAGLRDGSIQLFKVDGP